MAREAASKEIANSKLRSLSVGTDVKAGGSVIFCKLVGQPRAQGTGSCGPGASSDARLLSRRVPWMPSAEVWYVNYLSKGPANPWMSNWSSLPFCGVNSAPVRSRAAPLQQLSRRCCFCKMQ